MTPPQGSWGTVDKTGAKPTAAAAEPPEEEEDAVEAYPPEEAKQLSEMMRAWLLTLPRYNMMDKSYMLGFLLRDMVEASLDESGMTEIVSRLKVVEQRLKIEVPEDHLTDWDDSEEEGPE